MREVNAVVVENKEIAEEIFALTFSCGESVLVRAGQFCMIGVMGFPLRRPIEIGRAHV